MALSCSYCVPVRVESKRGKKRQVGRRGEEGTGLYLEQAALGIQEGTSPALQSEVSRMGVLLGSNKITQEELKRRGVVLNEKTVRNILLVTGLLALAARRDRLIDWREGKLTAGTELHGKRVGVAVDGGRVRTREAKKGRRTPKGRRRFTTPWREPKLLRIYVLDEEGRMDASFSPVVDGTFGDADVLMELVAYHLARLGGAHAKKVVFLGDGAEWIWDRVGMVAEKVGLQKSQYTATVDLYHVMEQLNDALKTVSGWDDATRKRERKKLKNWLLQSETKKVISYLKNIREKGDAQVVNGRIEYVRARKELIRYRQNKWNKLPIGSGAIESSIRRIVNLRLKCPTMYWLPDHAEAILHLRAQALTNRWDELMEILRNRVAQSRSRKWKIDPTPMSCKHEDNLQLAKDKKLALLK